MRATGIIRRIDDLGKIVIPKDIRRNLSITGGDPIEFYIEKDFIVLKKYTKEDDFFEELNQICEKYTDEIASDLIGEFQTFISTIKNKKGI